MNWGWKIVVVYAVFVTGIMYLVIKARHQNFDMVEKNYYQRELEFEKKLEASRNYAALGQEVQVELSGEQVVLTFPQAVSGGELWLYCTHDSHQDIRQPITTDASNMMSVPVHGLSTGNYLVQCTWKQNERDFYFQHSLYIP
ncbi:MAG: FixH family protein [Flavobacteriales bacterium]|nr:FixH family protein [Flavobacteriales bacterium]